MGTDSNQADIPKKTPQLVKISSRDGTERLVRQALPGLGMTYVAKPPSAIPVKLSHHYFLLEKSGNEWEVDRAGQESRGVRARGDAQPAARAGDTPAQLRRESPPGADSSRLRAK